MTSRSTFIELKLVIAIRIIYKVVDFLILFETQLRRAKSEFISENISVQKRLDRETINKMKYMLL